MFVRKFANVLLIVDGVPHTSFHPFQFHCRDAASKISEIINELGEASARAQGLNKPVTTAQKLRNSDHVVYLLTEKTGKK